jgi:hypothetical protein
MNSLTVMSQVRPGIKFGISTPDVSPRDFLVHNNQGADFYQIAAVKARYGVHAGAFIQMQIGGFFIQPEILYNSTSVDYQIEFLFKKDMDPENFRDSYRHIDFPVLLGLKSGPVRLGVGPVGHIRLDQDSGFSAYEGYIPVGEELTWGWQAGLGLDFWKLHVDIRYEGNFNKLGDHLSFFGNTYDFDTNNNRMIASLGFSF